MAAHGCIDRRKGAQGGRKLWRKEDGSIGGRKGAQGWRKLSLKRGVRLQALRPGKHMAKHWQAQGRARLAQVESQASGCG